MVAEALGLNWWGMVIINSMKSSWKHAAAGWVRGAIIVTLIALTACAEDGADAENRLAVAKQLLAAGDFNGAVLELKSAVQADKNNNEARFILAQTYLETGNAAGALKEFERVRESGMAGAELNIGLTRAMILSGKFDAAATEISISGNPEQKEWLLLQGLLDYGLNRYEAAKENYQKVLALDPQHIEAHRGLLQTELALGNRELARAEISRALEVTQDDLAIWMLKGQLDISEDRFEEARSSYQKALSLAPKSAAAHLGLAMAMVSLDALPEAIENLDALGPSAEEDPRVNYLRALIAKKRGEPESALQYARKVLRIAPNHVPTMMLAATLNMQLGDYSAAEDQLNGVLAIEPDHSGAKRMLGAVRLAAGHLDEALASVPDLNIETLENPQMLALLGAAYLKSGRYVEGEKSLSKAYELSPDSAPIRTQLALSKLSLGKTEEGLADLAEIRSNTPDFAQAYLLSVVVYLHLGDGDRALEMAQSFLEQDRNSAMARNLIGFVQQRLGHDKAARENYEAALAIDEAFHPAQLNLARMAAQAGDDEQVTRRLESILKQTPYYPGALLGLASLAVKNNDLDEAERLWQEARQHNPHADAPRVLLANHYLNAKNLPRAKEMAIEAHDVAPDSVLAQLTYANVMLASGDAAAAVPALERLAARAPVSTVSLQLLADAYSRLGNKDGLEKTLRLITAQDPGNVGANTALAGMAVRRGEFADAYAIAEKLIAVGDTSAAGYVLKGDILMADGKRDEAIAAYARAHELAPSSQTVLKLFAAEKQAGGNPDRLVAWLENNPDDSAVRTVYATELQADGRRGDAITQYERVLAQGVSDPGVLNNLAWLYNERGTGEALEFARRAFDSAPERAEIMDTYGWILVTQGQPEQGLELLRKAIDRAPKNADIRYHLAQALARTGENEAALKELKPVLDGNDTFSSRAEAETLLKKLTDSQ